MRRSIGFALAVLSAWLAMPVGGAIAGFGVEYSGVQQIVLQNGLNGWNRTTDTRICSSKATTNFGSADSLKLSGSGWTGYDAGQNRILIKGDIQAALDDSAVVVQAYFGMYQCSGYAASAALDTVDVKRVGAPWVEGTGGNAGAVQSGSACWTNRSAGPTAWQSAGCSATTDNGTIALYVNQWASWNGLTSGGDSTCINPAMCGTDTLYNGLGSLVKFDQARDPISTTTLKVGTPAGKYRQGWVFWDVSKQVRLWQIGANEDDGFLLQFHNQTANRMFAFYSSNYGTTSWQKAHRPMFIIRYIVKGNRTSTVAAGAGAGSGRGGIKKPGLGVQ